MMVNTELLAIPVVPAWALTGTPCLLVYWVRAVNANCIHNKIPEQSIHQCIKLLLVSEVAQLYLTL